MRTMSVPRVFFNRLLFEFICEYKQHFWEHDNCEVKYTVSVFKNVLIIILINHSNAAQLLTQFSMNCFMISF